MPRRRRLVVASLFAFALSFLFGSSAQAYPEVGISQSFRDFGLNLDKGGGYNPDNDVSRSVYWAPLDAKQLRVIVPWDIADRGPGDGRVQEFVNWLKRVKELGAEPFVVFGPSERNSTSTDTAHNPPHFQGVVTRRSNPYYNGTTETNKEALVPPPTTVYRTAIEDFLATWGPGTGAATGVAEVRTIGAWNEPNVGKVSMGLPGGITGPVILAGGNTRMWETQGGVCPSGSSTDSNCGPLAAARFWNNARAAMSAVCSTCKVVAGEFDSDGLTNGPRFWALYAEKIEILGSARPQVMSFHGHHDVEALGEHGSQDCTSTNTQYCITRNFSEWLKGLKGAWATMPIWDTEVGAQHYAGTSPSSDDTAQRNRFNNLINLEETYGVSRFYYYNFQHQAGVNDRSLIDSASGGNPDGVNARPRPLWDAIRCRTTGCAAWPLPAPAVNTGGVANVATTSATATGLVAPNGQKTGTFIEYGTTTSYGSAVLAGELTKNQTMVWVSANLPGLAPGTTYHYRVGASNLSGWGYGADQTFKTAGTPAESDVNGDHMSDFVSLKEDGYVLTATGQASLNIGGTLATSFTGDFDSAQYDGVGYFPIDVEDVNGDGYDDLVAIHYSGTVCTYLGQPDGRFGTWIGSMTNTLTPAVLSPGSGRYEPIAVADINGDGRGDLVVYDTSGKTVQTYLGLSSGGFSPTPVNSIPGADSATFDSSGEYFVDAADVNGDGRADLVSQNTSGYGRTYLGNASGGFSSSPVQSFSGVMAPSMATGSGWEPVGLGDVNGDGRADFVTAHSNGEIYTYFGNTDGSFYEWKSAYGGAADSDLYDSSGIEFAGVLDINGDGYADLIAAHPDGYIRISPGSAGGYFGSPTLNWSGNFKTARHQGGGRQIVTEKPIRRRNGCAPNGCH